MFDLFLTEPFVPFTISLALLFGLLALECILALVGATLLGLGADADVDLDLDVDAPDIGDLDIDFGEADATLFDFAEPELDADLDIEAPGAEGVSTGPASWLGIGKVPTLIWMAAVLLGFGVTGIVAQNASNALFGVSLPAGVAVIPAAVAGLWFARQFGGAFARMLPKTESTAMSARHLGRRMGVVTQGTARRGKPSEVRVKDRFGNTHYLRGEPLKDDEEIPAGTEVLVLRHRLEQGYRLVPLGQIN
ncbi:MAG: OB-fold-containig protein [Pseudomonadota bacterium]